MKYCTRCGRALHYDAVVCPNCGCAVGRTIVRNETNGMAIAGFILSFFIPLLGFIFGIIGLHKAKEVDTGKGLSVAAIIISLISFVVSVFILISVLGLAFI